MSNNKRLANNMFANLVAFGVQFGINILLTSYITETLGSEAYAFIPLSNNIASYATIITVAISSMASRFISIEFNQGNMEKANEYFNSVLIANVILAVFLTIPSVLVVVFSERILDVPIEFEMDVRITLGFALVGMLVSVLFSVYSNVYFVKNRLDIKAKNEIYGNIVRVFVLFLLFYFFKPHIYYATATTLLITLFYCFLNVYNTKKILPELSINTMKFRKRAVFTLLSSGIWNSINQLSSVLLSTLDLVLANVLVGAEESGVYAIAKTVPSFLQSLIAVVVAVFVPQFTILYAKKQKKELLKSIDFSVKILGATMTLPIAFLLVFGEQFFQIWVPTQNAVELQRLSMLTIIPAIVSAGINTLFNVFTVTNRLKVPSIVLLVSGVLNTVITGIMLKNTDMGVLVVPLVSCVILLIKNLTFTPIYAAHCLKEKWYVFYLPILKGIICTLSMVLICSVYKAFVPIKNWGGLILAGCVCSAFALCFNFFIVFDKNEKQKVVIYVKHRMMK